ncbi:DNA recombination protein RmuC [Ornithinicoccus hortensis]|uniref:DNA recombination protein RmuC n=1 Tax=Ornithinicoccus hortensis TaxID=82346 RepID=A0A542YPV7_9MICO|nr:DNA recombination protein RmuC [Ornithinicoccus hortensis]TQL50091.1 DNA recombination protein RmuC [Ornithinicoccus hortensis]
MEIQWVAVVVVVACVLGMTTGWLLARASGTARLARVTAERDVLASQVRTMQASDEEDRHTAAELAPLRRTLDRVEQQVQALERDRLEQFGQVGERLAEVAGTTADLRSETASLAGALNSSGIRGTWGEQQLRRILEHAGMLTRCDFDEQVSSVSGHGARIRPDAVVWLPGERSLVIDSKAPMTKFLQAQAPELSPADRATLLGTHADAVRRHVDSLADKAYWTAFTTAPEMVVCFVPSDAVLAAALHAQPDLYDHAQSRKVVLASPATLLALLRAVAYGWQQQALTDNARELLALGQELHRRLATLGKHVGDMGGALRRSVEAYNKMVGALESRVLVTSRRMQELGVAEAPVPTVPPVEETPRPVTTAELLLGELDEVAGPGSADPEAAIEDALARRSERGGQRRSG